MTNNKEDSVKFVTCTPKPEEMMVYIARVSNPNNQNNPKIDNLIKYCINNNHWSVFEHAYLTVEINTQIFVATQILRHRSMVFQQFSARYSDVNDLDSIGNIELRQQSVKNRQSSTTVLDKHDVVDIQSDIEKHNQSSMLLYNKMIDRGVAKECARSILPQCTKTRLYMTGNCRSWIHYIKLRTSDGTQKEHRNIALKCRDIFSKSFPITSSVLSWL